MMLNRYMVVADESHYEIYVKAAEAPYAGAFVCRCNTWEYTKKIWDALEKEQKDAE